MPIHFDPGVWIEIELSSPILTDALSVTQQGQAEINHLQQDDRNLYYRPLCFDAYLLYWSFAMRWRWTQRLSRHYATQTGACAGVLNVSLDDM